MQSCVVREDGKSVWLDLAEDEFLVSVEFENEGDTERVLVGSYRFLEDALNAANKNTKGIYLSFEDSVKKFYDLNFRHDIVDWDEVLYNVIFDLEEYGTHELSGRETIIREPRVLFIEDVMRGV